MNCEQWDSIQAWRDAFSLACLLKASAKLDESPKIQSKGDTAIESEALPSAMRDLDLALMMGGPLFKQHILEMVKWISSLDSGKPALMNSNE